MKRYQSTLIDVDGETVHEMALHPEGEWVRYDHVAELETRLAAAIEEHADAERRCECAQERISGLEHDLAALRAELEAAKAVPGIWFCSTCGFVEHRQILNAQSGNLRADIGHPGSCPNDETPMQAMTWEKLARDNQSSSVEIISALREQLAAAQAEIAAMRGALKEATNLIDELANYDTGEADCLGKTAGELLPTLQAALDATASAPECRECEHE